VSGRLYREKTYAPVSSIFASGYVVCSAMHHADNNTMRIAQDIVICPRAPLDTASYSGSVSYLFPRNENFRDAPLHKSVWTRYAGSRWGWLSVCVTSSSRNSLNEASSQSSQDRQGSRTAALLCLCLLAPGAGALRVSSGRNGRNYVCFWGGRWHEQATGHSRVKRTASLHSVTGL